MGEAEDRHWISSSVTQSRHPISGIWFNDLPASGNIFRSCLPTLERAIQSNVREDASPEFVMDISMTMLKRVIAMVISRQTAAESETESETEDWPPFGDLLLSVVTEIVIVSLLHQTRYGATWRPYYAYIDTRNIFVSTLRK